MTTTLLAIFLLAFLFNFLWEVWHSQLYTTCLTMPLPKLISLLTWQSLKDAFWIVLWYAVVGMIYHTNVLNQLVSLGTFCIGLIMFSFVVERHALRTKRWEYTPTMPMVLGVGLTPLIELVATGLAAVAITLAIL